MDIIYQIIKIFKKEEIRSFKLFTQRYKGSTDSKIITLFDKIREAEGYEDNPEQFTKVLFKENPDNYNAYYRLKNRLKEEIEKSLLNMHHDIDVKVSLTNYINLANIFTYKSDYGLALYYLSKAEKLSEKYEHYDILEVIYNEIISLSHNFDEIDPFEYIQKFNNNKKRKEISVQIDQAIATVRNKLKQTNFSKIDTEVNIKLQEILNDLNIAKEIYDSPNVKLKIHITVRDLLLHNSDFINLEKYLIDSYNEFEEEQFFTKVNHPSKINLITWIINTLNINKKYQESIRYTELLFEELNKFNKIYFDQYSWTYYQSLITNYISSGQLDKSIELLEYIKELPAHKGVVFYDYAIYVNLSLCYYFSQKNTLSIRNLNEILSKEKFPKFSTEHQLSLLLLEMVFHLDSNNFDFVEYKIKEIKTKYKTLLKKEVYQDEKEFLKIVNQIVSKPNPFRNEQILLNINNFLKVSNTTQLGSNKHIDFRLWLQSKLEKKSYYDVLLESLS